MSKEEIDQIHDTQNYFLYKDFQEHNPIWVYTNRKYGRHLFEQRTTFLSYHDTIKHIVTDGFSIKYFIQTLFRGQLGVHGGIGALTPSINLAIGSNIPGIINQTFSGLFGFLSPSTWLNLADNILVYKALKHLLVKNVLDQILQAKLFYLTQHQNITDFEILNYYYIHLQILIERFPNIDRNIQTLMAEFAVEGTDMASQRGTVKLGFDDLAIVIALEKLKGDYSVNNFNIELLNIFPEQVKDLEDITDEVFNNKEKFLEQVVRKSVELKALKDYLEIAKINIGIAAIGGTLQNITVPNNASSVSLAVRLGYGTLPAVFTANSIEKTAEIDVWSGYLQMLDNARRSFDLYTNSLGGYTEAKRSIVYSRKALSDNIKHILETRTEPDALFITSLTQLIRAELKLNNALHGSLRAHANMLRYLLIDDEGVLHYLPQKEKLFKHFYNVKKTYTEQSDKERALNRLLIEAKNRRDFQDIVNNNNFTKEEIAKSIRYTLPDLISHHCNRNRSKGFYKILRSYIHINKIEISSTETMLVDKNAFGCCKYKKQIKEPYETFDFKHFSVTRDKN